jgi:phage shock protein A
MDAEFVKHSAAFKDASSTLAQLEARIEEKEADLANRQKQIATFKAELQQMQRSQQRLKEEKSEALADVAVAQQMESINNVLAGISEDSTDKDLEAARKARERAKASAEIASELTGNDARAAESEYLTMAAGSQADAELDGLLNWGDEESDAKIANAKLPE